MNEYNYVILDTAEVDGNLWYQLVVSEQLYGWVTSTQSSTSYFIVTGTRPIIIDVSDRVMTLIKMVSIEQKLSKSQV